MGRHIALLRGTNFAGGSKIPMAELRALDALEHAISTRFGLAIPVVIDRFAGSPSTSRNRRTALHIVEMLGV